MIQEEEFDYVEESNYLDSFNPTHPGAVIKEELEFRGISQRALAKAIGEPPSKLNEVLNARRQLCADMALLIGKALGMDAVPLLEMQMKFNLLSAKRKKKVMKRLKIIRNITATT